MSKFFRVNGYDGFDAEFSTMEEALCIAYELEDNFDSIEFQGLVIMTSTLMKYININAVIHAFDSRDED